MFKQVSEEKPDPDRICIVELWNEDSEWPILANYWVAEDGKEYWSNDTGGTNPVNGYDVWMYCPSSANES